ncbi:DoxX-like family protein [Metabacillus idriensis]|uniref:DoxX-like family protein n=1 Tax=Metabacillus idriensis TaxID=324768 RepID=UPI00174D1DB2|nr:DoxX-like family protein [Metabacillus idriensis]
MKNKPIYVELSIHSDMDKLWDATQIPALHSQWDLRFSSITYLPKIENEPQHFLYKTNIGFGLNVQGWGKSIGSFRSDDGSRTSSLHFGTDQKMSIIKEGKGYWKYKPERNAITFLTQYDYKVNFGKAGVFFDTVLFRPLIGWATALSFDVLKRWLEKEEAPAFQYIRFFSTWLISFLFFFIWTYHGAVPKILFMHPEEVSMTKSLLSLTMNQASALVAITGIAEILFGLLWLLPFNKVRLFGLQIMVFPPLTFSAILAEPSNLIHPFSPLTYNAALFILSIIGYIVSRDLPTAKSCKRKR